MCSAGVGGRQSHIAVSSVPSFRSRQQMNSGCSATPSPARSEALMPSELLTRIGPATVTLCSSPASLVNRQRSGVSTFA